MVSNEASSVPDEEADVDVAEEQQLEIADNDENEAEDTTVIESQNENNITSTNPQTAFLDYLTSSIVQLMVSDPATKAEPTTLSAHRAILIRAPYFADLLSDASTTSLLLEEDLDAMVCFLQYQYTGEYFPRRSNTSDGLEKDPSLAEVDFTGAQLLKHARVYTLAGKLGLPQLKELAHSKIHRINSTAAGEIVYARYVYGHTLPSDETIRKPVAAFWATRSHVLRHEAEQDFRAMCLEFPQFGFDVLNLLLDQREKKIKDRNEDLESNVSLAGTPAGAGHGRKRMRLSVKI